MSQIITDALLRSPGASAVSDAKDARRCSYRYPNGYRCRLVVLDTARQLCFNHAKQRQEEPDLADLSPDLFADEPADLQTVEQLNDVLARVVLLLAKGRISPRRAAVITYACNLLLRCVVVIDDRSVDHSGVPRWDVSPINDGPRPDRTAQLAELQRRNDQTGDPHASSPYSRPQT